MSRLKLDQDTLALASLLEKITRARVKDCFKDDAAIYFVIAPGDMGRALGKSGVNIKRFQQETGKKIKLIEYQDNVVDFVKNVIYPLKVEEIIEENGAVVLKDKSKKIKSMIIGRDGKNLSLLTRAVKRFFDVTVEVM